MEQTDVVKIISSLLDSGKYKEALSVSSEEKYQENFRENCWDLISIIVGKIKDDTAILKPSLHGACEELLSQIIQKSTLEESLLELIEQVELAKNDAQLGIILTPLHGVLKNLSVKRGRSLEWCLNSISNYIEKIPMPDYQLEGKERLLLDCDNNVRRIVKVYSLLPPFYSPFIKEVNLDNDIRVKQIITAFLISLLGKPLIEIDLDPESNSQSEARYCCSTIIQDICTLEKDVFKFLMYLHVCYNHEQNAAKSKYDNNDEVGLPYENKDKVNLTSLSGLFYTVLSGHFDIPDTAIPQVYSNDYIVHNSILSANHLMTFTTYGPLSKAMSLCKALIMRIPNNTSYTALSNVVYYELCKNLTNVAIYSSYESVRKIAINMLDCYIKKFMYKGRCMLIKYIMDSSNHSGMIGYAITLLKNSLNEAFIQGTLPECFTGPQLEGMIKKICYLPHGAESDLVELGDQIISTLNFLRYLAIKDVGNLTGIRNCFTFIEKEYLETLRTGLNMSKAHYEIKLKDVKEGRNLSQDIDVSLNVGGNVLDNIPTENKKMIINSALNAFHLIEGLIARFSECMNINKMQALNMDCVS